MQQLVSVEGTSRTAAGAGSPEAAKGISGVGIDTRGPRPSQDQMNRALSGANVPAVGKPIPVALANNPEYKQLNQRAEQNQQKLTDLNSQLQKVEQQRQTATGPDKGKLEVQEAQLKQQISNVNNDNNFVQYKMHDMQVKFDEEQAVKSPARSAVPPPPLP